MMRIAMGVAWFCGLACMSGSVFSQDTTDPVEVGGNSSDALILVVGAAGEEEYAESFAEWADDWQQLATQKNWELVRVGNPSPGEKTDKECLREAFETIDADRVWVVLIGHGTFGNNVPKFNLMGPDVAAKELASWLDGADRQYIVVNCSSSSAPFLTELAGERRIVITATRSGSEINFARFGKFFAEALDDLSVDIDHDREVSLLEVFLAASARTERFYQEAARLATEHALLDDNGDKAGTLAAFYRGIRPSKSAQGNAALDGRVASRVILFSAPGLPLFTEALAAKRADIERRLDTLRGRKGQMASATYDDQLELLMLEMADVYDLAEQLAEEEASTEPGDADTATAGSAE